MTARAAFSIACWLASPCAGGVPAEMQAADAGPEGPAPAAAIRLSEVHYHPAPAAGQAEFIELHNAGTGSADLTGWRFTKGIRFTFAAGAQLAPGAHAVVCQDLGALRAAFGEEVRVLGVYEGALDNAGDLIRLVDAASRTVTDVRYLESPPWPDAADGRGSSLQRVRLDRDADDPTNWTAAPPTPGKANADPGPLPPLGLYRAEHSPRSPPAAAPIAVTVRVRGEGGAPRCLLHYEARGRRASVPMQPVPAARGANAAADPPAETAFTAAIPPQPAATLVRYWIEASTPDGFRATLPPREAPSPVFLAYVRGAAVTTRLPLYELVIEPRNLRALAAGPYANDLQPAVLVAGDELHEVQVRHRGAWARSWPKKSWKIVFRKDQPFGDVRRLNLNSAWHDPAFIREVLAYRIYRECGAHSLAARMVRLHVNGEFWGLFVEVEQPKKKALAGKGLRGAALYKATSRANLADERAFGSAEEYAGHYTLETAAARDHEDLHRFCSELAEAADPGSLLAGRLDVSRYVNYLAAGTLIQNWDGLNKNHFLARAAPDPGAGGAGARWHVLPWDLDRTFGDHWNWRFDVATVPLLLGIARLPGTTGWNRLQERFLAQPAFRRRFEERVAVLLREVFTAEQLGPVIDELRDSIALEADLDRRRWGGELDWRGAIEQLKRYVAQRRTFLLAELPGGEPRPPRNLKPAAGAAAGPAVTLESSPFAPDDPGERHALSRWQVRSETDGRVAMDGFSAEPLLALTLPAGLLAPRTTYRWRVAHVSAGGKTSAFSEETSFTTGDFAFAAVPFDLGRHCNADLVAGPGEAANDPVDERGGVLIVDGFDGRRAGNPLAQGLPRDGAIGVHRLGAHDRPNAIQLRAGAGPVRIAPPPGSYALVRFLVTGGAGDSRLPVRFEYADGSSAGAVLPCDDWYDDHPPEGAIGEVQPGATPIVNGMDRLRGGTFKDRNEPALFEVVMAADTRKTLAAIVLRPGQATFDRPGQTTFNLFAVTGVRVGVR